MMKLALSALACAAILRADFDPTHWQFRRLLDVKPAEAIANVKIDTTVYRGSAAQLADLRVIRAGVERPFLLETLRGSFEEKELQPALIDKSTRPAAGVEVTLDLGGKASHNRLRVTTPERNFKQRVRIETSDDAKHWAIAHDDGYIFDFSQGDRHVSVLTVDYPVSTRRYVRATIYGWNDPKSLASAWLTYWVERPDTRETSAAFDKPAPVQDSKSQSTSYPIDFGYQGLAHDELQVEVEPALFYRPIEIETSRNAKDWSYAGQGVIYRTADQEKLSATFTELWDRYLRIRIINRDDQPLGVKRITVQTIERRVKFPVDRTGQYWLYYGNPDAKTPAYDLAFVLPKDGAQGTPMIAMGPQQTNPDYRAKPLATLPWTDRHPNVLYGVLTAAIIGMGYVTVRFLMKVRTSGGPG